MPRDEMGRFPSLPQLELVERIRNWMDFTRGLYGYSTPDRGVHTDHGGESEVREFEHQANTGAYSFGFYDLVAESTEPVYD